MRIYRKEILVVLITVLVAACEAVVGDFEVESCDPDTPTVCTDLGDETAQVMGCCSSNASKVWWCENGEIRSQDCNDFNCDYDPDQKKNTCVE